MSLHLNDSDFYEFHVERLKQLESVFNVEVENEGVICEGPNGIRFVNDHRLGLIKYFFGPDGEERLVWVKHKKTGTLRYFDGPAGEERHVRTRMPDGDVVYFKGYAGEERIDFEKHVTGCVRWFDGATTEERLVRIVETNGVVQHLKGPRSEERFVRTEFPDGSVVYFDGLPGEERCVALTRSVPISSEDDSSPPLTDLVEAADEAKRLMRVTRDLLARKKPPTVVTSSFTDMIKAADATLRTATATLCLQDQSQVSLSSSLAVAKQALSEHEGKASSGAFLKAKALVDAAERRLLSMKQRKKEEKRSADRDEDERRKREMAYQKQGGARAAARSALEHAAAAWERGDHEDARRRIRVAIERHLKPAEDEELASRLRGARDTYRKRKKTKKTDVHPASAPPTAVKAAQEVTSETVSDADACIICMELPRTHVACACGHNDVCGRCAARVKHCPVCCVETTWVQLRRS